MIRCKKQREILSPEHRASRALGDLATRGLATGVYVLRVVDRVSNAVSMCLAAPQWSSNVKNSSR